MSTRNALVTGAATGIGKAIADIFRKHDIDVLCPTIEELDLLSNESISSYLSRLPHPVDILVNNAGINPLAGITEISEQDIDDTLHVNLIGPILLMKGIIPGMIKRGYGKICNISSIWSAISKPRRTIYAASKAGISAVTRTAALEYAESNILVNAVAPGFINTELTKKNNSPDEIRAIAKTIPLKRLAEPTEVAELVLFLCSERNTFITGQTIFIDGGYTCQ